jgi:AcrR family transcriptional regulator
VAAPAPNRFERRKNATRQKLLDAGRQCFGEKGVDLTTIQDITDAADLGRGTFYNFFETKDELVDAIGNEHVAEIASVEAELMRRYDDPILAMAACMRYGFAMLTENAGAAHFVIRTQRISGPLFKKFHDVQYAIIEAGMSKGVFQVQNIEVAVVLIAGATLATVEGIVIGLIPSDSVEQVVEYSLRSLGLDMEAAREAATAPLPPIDTTL